MSNFKRKDQIEFMYGSIICTFCLGLGDVRKNMLSTTAQLYNGSIILLVIALRSKDKRKD
jgi:hypothetical protein